MIAIFIELSVVRELATIVEHCLSCHLSEELKSDSVQYCKVNLV